MAELSTLGAVIATAYEGTNPGNFKADGSVDMTGQFRTDVGTFDSDVANGASANAYDFDTQNTYSTAGANLLRLRNNATAVFDFSYQGGIDHVNSGASTAAHSQSLNLNWASSSTKTSSGQYSSVIGNSNLASGIAAASLGGGLNSSTGNYSFTTGYFNTASGQYAFAAGDTSTASGSQSVCFGSRGIISGDTSFGCGVWPTTTNRATIALGVNWNSGNIPTQVLIAGMSAATTDATPTAMTAAGANYVIPADTTWAFSALIAARSDETDANRSMIWEIKGGLTRDESNNTALIGSITKTVIADGASSEFDVTIVANDTAESLSISVTGKAATNVRWGAKVDLMQVYYP